MEKTVSFWDPVKKFRRCHQKCSIKKAILKTPQYSQEITCVWVSFDLCWSPCKVIKKRLQRRCFPVNIAHVLRTAFFTEHLRATASKTWIFWNFIANKLQINSRDKSRDASHTPFKNISEKILSKAS